MTDILYETDVQDMIEELDWEIEDYGIGSYTFGDGNYVDKRLSLALQDNQISIKYVNDPEQVIFTMILGTKIEYGQVGEYEFEYRADLVNIDWCAEEHVWIAEYEVDEQ